MDAHACGVEFTGIVRSKTFGELLGTPAQICIGTSLGLLAYIATYLTVCFELRNWDTLAAYCIGPGLFLLVALVLAVLIRYRQHDGRPWQFLLIILLNIIIGASAGTCSGEWSWRSYTAAYFEHQKMASYVNVDPDLDTGQAYMDASVLYFKEDVHVLRKRALAFRNGRTYCVAPIVHGQLEQNRHHQYQNSRTLSTETYYTPPKSGSIDFWAVGTDCCGTTGTDNINGFTCGDALSKLARAGLRVMDSNERKNFLLATQQWSASTGLPARHPLFFTWVKDPLTTQYNEYAFAQTRLGNSLPIVLVLMGVTSFITAFSYQYLHDGCA